MATVTACYDATPAPRTVADILPANRAEREARTKGPRARARQLDASLERSTATMVSDLFDAAERRDPDHRRRWIVLVDGANHQLDCIKREAAARGVTVDIIVDIVHVIEYVWRCADDLHPDKSARTAWVADAIHRVLEGKSARVVADIRAVLRAGGHGEGAKPAAERAVDYLTAKQPYLHYHRAIALGWPIATGVIEGACRHIVKDRLDLTGARWGLDGAEAILLLRAVINNGDFENYWRFHTHRDYQRTHAARYRDQLALAV
jgi:hypothetical protein